MANRYERKWTMMENLYVKGSPVLIEAGALLKDNDTSKMIAQLKFRNIGTKRIKALFVGVKTYDVAGKELDEIDEFQYLDLNVRRDDVFGSNTPIVLKEEITRSFACTCKKVLFDDGSEWTCQTNEKWEPLPQIKKRELFQDEELEKQFIEEYGRDCEFQTERLLDLWYCACGAINREEEEKCFRCKKEFSKYERIDVDILEKKKEERLESEKREEENQRKQEEVRKEERRKKQQETKRKVIKAAKIAGPILVVVVLIIILMPKLILPGAKYLKANNLVKHKDFDAGIEIFEELNGFLDSEERILESRYLKAEDMITKEEYESADLIFTELGSYRDSSQRIGEGYFLKGKDLFEDQKYEEAIEYFQNARTFNGAEEMIQEAELAIKERDYNKALSLLEQKEYDDARELLRSLGDYMDSSKKIDESFFNEGKELMAKGALEEAYHCFANANDYGDSYSLKCECAVNLAIDAEAQNDSQKAAGWYKAGDNLAEAYRVEYEYVLAHRNNEDTLTAQFLEELKKEEYEDSAKIYDDLYTWHIEVITFVKKDYSPEYNVPSTSVTQYTFPRTGAASWRPIVAIRASGGKPGERLTLEVVFDRKLGDPHTNTLYPNEDWDGGKTKTVVLQASDDWTFYSMESGSNVLYTRVRITGPSIEETVIMKTNHSGW